MIFQSKVPGRSLKHSKLISNWTGLRMEEGLFLTRTLLICTCAIGKNQKNNGRTDIKGRIKIEFENYLNDSI